MKTVLRLLSLAALAALATGCATLNPSPPVDILSTAPLQTSRTIPVAAPVTGSLFRTASYRPVFEDQRARMVGDIVTIMIDEEVTAKQNSKSTVNRNSSNEAGINALPFVGSAFTDKLKLGTSNASVFGGDGKTENNNNFTGSITTTVIDVLPSGHLVVAGEKQIGLNENVDVLRISGTVDPRALRPGTGKYEGSGSVINSRLVANARVQSRGRGAQSEAQTMGWLHRAFNSVTPF